MYQEIIMGGVGGQGIMVIGNLLEKVNHSLEDNESLQENNAFVSIKNKHNSYKKCLDIHFSPSLSMI